MTGTLRDLMTSHPVILDASATVEEAARAMRDHNVGDVLVKEDGELFGIVTDRDIVVRCIAEHADPWLCRIGELCSDDLATLEVDASLDEAIALMQSCAVRRLPVVERGRVLGIISLGDLAVARDPGSALGQISAAPPSR